ETVQTMVVDDRGNRIYASVTQPRVSDNTGRCFAAVVIVPGGTSDGLQFTSFPEYADLASKGFVVVSYNPPGRGLDTAVDPRSDGLENFNGWLAQDSLKAVIETMIVMPNVADDNIGIQTYSWGIATGVGMLARYPELGVKYLVDVEGPSDDFCTSAATWTLDHNLSDSTIPSFFSQITGHTDKLADPTDANIAWWGEREAINYIGAIRAMYIRVQNMWDHVQPPSITSPDQEWYYLPEWTRNKHAIDMINAATQGNSLLTRVNGATSGNQDNTIYIPGVVEPLYAQYFQNGTPPDFGIGIVLETAKIPSFR
ncbi:MAG: hypothetical protein HQL08_15615, partial [Nitrospirae bacterium]|nr:hypothetical protein [Nitrospirota bacterium]